MVNADAIQVYKDLRILTARPSVAVSAAVPHALYGYVDGAVAYGVGAWLADAWAVLGDLARRGRPAVIVGGTGLYLDALGQGLSAVPPVTADVRAFWRDALAADGAVALHTVLQERDPLMAARLRNSDGQRIVRALEVIEGTGRSLAHWQEEAGPAPLDDFDVVHRVVLEPGRDVVRERIRERFDKMMQAGALGEAVRLSDRHLSDALPVMKAIGVAPLVAHWRGEINRSDAIAQAVTESRQYAKRQDTWFRNRFGDWPRAADVESAQSLILSSVRPAGLAAVE